MHPYDKQLKFLKNIIRYNILNIIYIKFSKKNSNILKIKIIFTIIEDINY